MALCNDTSDEEVSSSRINKKSNNNNNKNIKDEFPPLSLNKKLNNSNTLSFKNIITITHEKDAKNKADKEEAEIFQRLNIKKITREEVQVIAAPTEFLQVLKKKRNWADVYSSDEEEEEEDELKYFKKENNFISTYKNPYDTDEDDF